MSGEKGDLAVHDHAKYSSILRKKELIIRILMSQIFILLCIILCLTTLMFIYGLDYNDNDYQNISKFNNTSLETEDINIPMPPPSNKSTLTDKLKIIPRSEWLAQPSESPPTPLNHPVPFVIILHTMTKNCSNQAKCTELVRYSQNFHIKSDDWWDDISYNFLIGGDGNVYEGRGWKKDVALVSGWNAYSIGIAFIGDFNDDLPPERQILAAKMLIEQGVKDGFLTPDYKVIGHRQISDTQSPGDALYENVKTWQHWTENPVLYY